MGSVTAGVKPIGCGGPGHAARAVEPRCVGVQLQAVGERRRGVTACVATRHSPGWPRHHGKTEDMGLRQTSLLQRSSDRKGRTRGPLTWAQSVRKEKRSW